MEKISFQLDKIEQIIKKIEKSKLGISDPTNMNNILKINKNKFDKKSLDEKINKISLFTNQLNNLIVKLPNPDKIDKDLVEYTGYLSYYNKNK